MDNDLVTIHTSHPDMIQHGDIVVWLRPFERMTPKDVHGKYFKHTFGLTNDKVRIDEQFGVAVGSIRVPEGGARAEIINTAKSPKSKN